MILGLDVSHWNTPAWSDWTAKGYKFVFIKATEGTTWLDPRYAAHKRDAGDTGFVTGAYHYFRAAFDGTAQADFFWSVIGNTTLPPAIDVEAINNAGFSQSAFREQLRNCIIRIRNLSGKRPLIYTSKSKWELLVGSAPDIASQCDLWVADYGWDGNGNGISIPRLPKDWAGWAVWQYTSKILDQDRMQDSYWDALFPPPPPADNVTITLPKEVAEQLHTAIHNAT